MSRLAAPLAGRVALLVLSICTCVVAQRATPNLVDHIDRPLRYRPDAGDFVIENGPDSFNRPLYGGNTAFRADAGDKPEFSLFLPGRGGVLRLGISNARGSKWLGDAEKIVARYTPGTMIYEIRDPLLGDGVVRLVAVGGRTSESLLVQVALEKASGQNDLVIGFGGANGERGSRNGDIGTERSPVSQFWALDAAHCRGNQFTITGHSFVLQGTNARVAGLMPAGMSLAVADAGKWGSPSDLLASTGQADLPVIAGKVALADGTPVHLALERLAGAEARLTVANAQQAFGEAVEAFAEIRSRLVVDTPDSYINSAAAALVVAADAIWDEPQTVFMHGAVAWRSRYLGWRGVYIGDALGWHDRLPKHLKYWFDRQNTDPVEAQQRGTDPDSNYARSHRMIHSNGDLGTTHYDMQVVAFDALIRHLLWTGDLEYAREVWPIIERHMAREKRLFRREFGPEKLPLYEAYNVIWTSDDLQYNGGGTAHASAYNYYANLQFARVAKLIGKDPAPYEQEAELILKGMKELLWLQKEGWYGEYKDLLGNQLVHPAAAVWTHYHTIDSHMATPMMAWQMGRYIDTQIPTIPVKGPNVPPGLIQRSTTKWMPYTWSINNVVMSETIHTTLADFQAGRIDQALAAFKGAILDSMFLGQCPGNAGMATYYDDYRRESQRDFGDCVGITSRALIEGLFGVLPDLLGGEMLVRPQFPREWEHASIRHPDFTSAYRRQGQTEAFIVEPKFAKPVKLKLDLAARAVEVASVTVNGQPAQWENVGDAVNLPRIRISADPAGRWDVRITWRGAAPAKAASPAITAIGSPLQVSVAPAELLDVADPQGLLASVERNRDSIRATAAGAMGHRTAFAQVWQGQLSWWLPIETEVRPAREIVASPVQPPDGLRYRIRENLAGERFSDELTSPAALPGTNRPLGGNVGPAVEGVVVNWKIPAPADTRFEPVDLSSAWNDVVTNIFKPQYVSPRSPYASLAMPSVGVGGWATFTRVSQIQIDDSGLRNASATGNGRLTLPNGVPFVTPGPGDAKNIAFTSQWDVYPKELSVPISGQAKHLYLLMAGSTNHMQSQFTNGEVVVTYTDGTTEPLELRNPTTWWPIERDYHVDDYAFARPEPVPPRVNLRTAQVRIYDAPQIKGLPESVPGGAATVLDLPLNPGKELRSLTVRTIANEVVIGLMSATLVR